MQKKITISNIISEDMCTGCGSCLSALEQEAAMKWNEFGFLTPALEHSDISDISDAIKYCPFNPSPEKEIENEDKVADIFLGDATNRDNQIGRYRNIYAGHSNRYRANASSGGIATYIFEQLLASGVVDQLFIVKQVKGTYMYQFFNDPKEIEKISKTRYLPVTLEELFRTIDKIDGRIAVSGVACFIKAIRLRQYYNPKLKEKIPFLVGIICGGMKSRFFSDYLAQSAGIAGKYHNQEYRIKDTDSSATDYSFGAYAEDDNLHTIKIRTVGDMWGSGLFKANACDFCDDVTTELADISLGDAYMSPYNKDGKGTNVVLTRSELADKLIDTGITNGELTLDVLPLDRFKRSQRGGFNHRQAGLYYRRKRRVAKGKIVPSNRERHLCEIPLEFRIIQKERVMLREKSLILWRDNPSSVEFNNIIHKHRERLWRKTRIYHIVQGLKRSLKLKTIQTR